MRVYEVDYNVSKFVSLYYRDKWVKDNAYDALCMSGKRRAKYWHVPENIYILNPKRKVGDFHYLESSSFILTEKTKDILSSALPDDAYEFLPLQLDQQQLWLLNILEAVDCFDYGKELPPGPLSHVAKYAFDPEKFGQNSLFKMPTSNYARIFTYEGVKQNPEKEFKYLVEKHKLKGLEFTLLWDSDAEEKQVQVPSAQAAAQSDATEDDAVFEVDESKAAAEPELPPEDKMAQWLSHPNEFGAKPAATRLLEQRSMPWPFCETEQQVALVEYEMADGFKGIGVTGPVTWSFMGDTVPFFEYSHDELYRLYAGWYILFALGQQEDIRVKPNEKKEKDMYFNLGALGYSDIAIQSRYKIAKTIYYEVRMTKKGKAYVYAGPNRGYDAIPADSKYAALPPLYWYLGNEFYS